MIILLFVGFLMKSYIYTYIKYTNYYKINSVNGWSPSSFLHSFCQLINHKHILYRYDINDLCRYRLYISKKEHLLYSYYRNILK